MAAKLKKDSVFARIVKAEVQRTKKPPANAMTSAEFAQAYKSSGITRKRALDILTTRWRAGELKSDLFLVNKAYERYFWEE
jgi:hypothetical protein